MTVSYYSLICSLSTNISITLTTIYNDLMIIYHNNPNIHADGTVSVTPYHL